MAPEASPATMVRPSGVTAQQATLPLAVKVARMRPEERSHTFSVLSDEPEST